MKRPRKRSKVGPARPIRLGMTGGLASGKTTALQVFQKAGWATLSADQIVHEIYEEQGAELLELRRRCLDSKSALSRLEKKVHPLVRKKINRALRETRKNLVVEIPLLFEGGLNSKFDFNICIHAPLKERRIRAKKRGMSAKLFELLNSRQWSASRKAAAADFVVWNLDSQLPAFRRDLRRLISLFS